MGNNNYNNRDRDNLTSINSYDSGKKTLTVKDLKLTEKRTNYVKPSNEAEGLDSEIGKNLDELELEDAISSPSDLEHSFIYSIPLNSVGQLQLYAGAGFRIIKQINYSPIVNNDSILKTPFYSCIQISLNREFSSLGTKLDEAFYIYYFLDKVILIPKPKLNFANQTLYIRIKNNSIRPGVLYYILQPDAFQYYYDIDPINGKILNKHRFRPKTYYVDPMCLA